MRSAKMRRDLVSALLIILAAAVLATAPGCAKKRLPAPPPSTPRLPDNIAKGTYKPYTIMGRTYYPLADSDGFVQDGTASWYGRDFHGKSTANGETYDMHAMTAAHKILPMNTRIRVVNLENGRSAVLRVNDRGPFVKDRILDCSFKAATVLGFAEKGTARIRLETLPSQGFNVIRVVDAENFYVQVGAFTVRDNAERTLSTLRAGGYQGSRIQQAEVGGERFWRVQAGVFNGLDAVERAQSRLAADYPASFIVAD